MNLSETALMLAQMQAYDQRTVGESDVIAWHALLVDAPLADCQEAVRRHYADQTDRIMPAHVRRLVAALELERRREASPWAPGQYGVPREDAVAPALTAGAKLTMDDLTPEVADLISQVRALLPEGSREALAPRRVAWEREHRAFVRTQNPEPNPLYKPKAVEELERLPCNVCSERVLNRPQHEAEMHPDA